MKHQVKIKTYIWGYQVVVKRRFLWIFSYWERIYDSPLLEECEKFYAELMEGKHKELLEPNRENWLKNGV